jgi:hypothetical protein
MASTADVAALIATFPDVIEGARYGNRTWFVHGKAFAWERPFSKADLKRFGDQPVPAGPIVALRTADLEDKDAVLAEARKGFFTIPHFDGIAAVLVQLDTVAKRALGQAIEDAWLCCAPELMARAFLSKTD